MNGPLRSALRPPLEPGDEQRMWQRIAERRARRRASRRALVPALALACAGAALVLAYRANLVAPSAPAGKPAAEAARAPLRLASGAALATVDVPDGGQGRTLALSDGTRVSLAPGSLLSPRVVTAASTELELARGSARFSVQPQRGRGFAVVSGPLRVEVVGTVFAMERTADGRTSVRVEHGRVRVRAPEPALGGGATTVLGAGEQLTWPPAADAAPTSTEGAPATTPPTRTAAAAQRDDTQAHAPSPADDAAWRAAASAGDYARAYSLLGADGFARAVRSAADPDALLSLSDIARAAGRPAQAASALSRLLQRHADSEQAALAALTLGRLQLDALAQPGAAARSLRRAIELGLPGALYEDALARLVHAHAVAGDKAASARAAQDYRKRFPHGRYRSSVESWAASADAAAR
jgi:hypothetical protein